MRIACVIPSKNRPDGLLRLIASLRKQTVTVDPLVVVDDGSDVSLTVDPETLVLRNNTSQGPARARNQGWRQVSSEPFVLFVDDDVEFRDPMALERALKYFMAYERVGVVGLTQLGPDGRVRYVQPSSSNRSALTNRFYSYAFVARGEALKSTGGFYEPLFYYMEEIELSQRLLGHGWDIVFARDAEVLHHEDARGRNVRRIRELALRNSLLIVLKNYPAWAVPLGLLKSYINYLRNYPMDWSETVLPAIHGSTAFARMAKLTLSQRRSIGSRALLRYMELGRRPTEIGVLCI
jgi:GT2 family glycosyltransferase